jgi:hypothetical protein
MAKYQEPSSSTQPLITNVLDVHEDAPKSGPEINESHILQGRQIGVFGAISLIVNKIVGAGYISLLD